MVVFTSARERRMWLWALAVTAAIYATLGQVPAIAGALRDRDLLDNTFFGAFVVVVAALTIVGLTVRPGWREVTVVVAVLSTYLMAFLRFANPAERTHLVCCSRCVWPIVPCGFRRDVSWKRIAAPVLSSCSSTSCSYLA
jgi:hypothetical protein